MTAFPFSTVGFDLDGTLLDTSGDLAAAVNHALALDGRPTLPVAAIVPMIGGGSRQMLAHALAATGDADDVRLDELHAELMRYYDDHLSVHTRPYPHMVETLDALRAAGVRCAVATNKREAPTHALLSHFDLLDRFACVIGGDTLGAGLGKPKPDMILALRERCGGAPAAFVGDSRFDVEAAQAARVPVVACSFGFSGAGVHHLGADAVIDGFDQLIPTLGHLCAT